MEIGQRIISGLYDEYGAGTIISQRKLFGKLFYKVFFEAVGKTIELYEDDIRSIESPLDLYKSGIFSSTLEFKLNFLAHTIDASTSGEKPKIMPLPHQILALDRVINQFRPRYLLADEAGRNETQV